MWFKAYLPHYLIQKFAYQQVNLKVETQMHITCIGVPVLAQLLFVLCLKERLCKAKGITYQELLYQQHNQW